MFLLVVSAPWLLTVSLPLLGILRLFKLVHKPVWDKERDSIQVFIADGPATKWHYSTTIGHLVLLHPKIKLRQGETTLDHEGVHVRQHDDLMFVSLIVGGVVGLVAWNPWLFLGVWWSAGLWQLLFYITAAIRYGRKNSYRGAEHERAAYAQTDTAWLKHHLTTLKD